MENARIANPTGVSRTRVACSNVRHIMNIFYCDKTDSYHLPRRHVWTIRQSVNWYKDMYNRTIWKPLYCPILIPMTFIHLSSYRSRTRSILLVWRQNKNILLSLLPFQRLGACLLSNFRTYNNELAIHKEIVKRRIQNTYEKALLTLFKELNNYYVTDRKSVV